MATTTWQLDPTHSEVHFKVRHLLVSTVTGKFTAFQSSVTTEGDDFGTANIQFSVDVNSIDTGNGQRDGHLKSDDFFSAEKFPAITFQSTGIKPVNGDTFELDGDLTIRDVTKPVTLSVEFGGIAKDPWGNIKAGFEVTGKIKRKEFGLMWDALTEAGGAVVGDEIKLIINLEYAKIVEA